ncbi:type III polyketide synthase [Deinococcus lacus]|uniref:Type III polyketide synthase n=1 Tax=Deinococcus lacus TaxID=392561 RepID=A0ABW1Y9L0_9DEIO
MPSFSPVSLLSLQTAVPDYAVTQPELQAAAQVLFPRLAARASLLETFTNAQIDRRFLAQPLDWYLQPRSFAEKNQAFLEVGRRLTAQAAGQALEVAGVGPQEVSAVVMVNTTGISTPSLEVALMGRLGLNPHAVRAPLWGLGCAGGVAGLARAADLVRAGHRRVLFVAAELCSLTFLGTDESSSNFVGTALFADGAAAAVLGPGPVPGHLTLLGQQSTLFPSTEDIMGWEVLDQGLKVRFSRDIPTLVRREMAGSTAAALAQLGWTLGDIGAHAVHPGGAKVLNAYEEALALPPEALDISRQILREYGNMSSVTVLFVLAELLRRGHSGRVLMSALGPGFSAEHLLAEF